MRNNTFLSISLLLGVSFIVFFRWMSFGIFTSGDWGFTFAETYAESIKWSAWVSNFGLGQIDLLLWRVPVGSLFGFLGALGFDQNISEKLLVFWPSIILANLSIFLISKKVVPSNLGATIAAFIFNLSTYYFVSSSAFLLYSSTSFLLVSLLFLMNALETKKIYQFIGFVITFFITTFFDFRITYIGLFLLAGYGIYFEFIIKESSIVRVIKNLLIFIPILVIVLFLNFYWMLPLSQSSLLTQNTVLNRGLFGNEFLNIFYAYTVFHPFWTGSFLAIFETQKIQLHFWIIPFIAFFGLYLNKYNKKIYFFAIVALIGILLTKQAGSPFPTLYKWLFENFPGFNAFREASKFYFLILLGYAILISAFTHTFYSWLNKKGKKVISFLAVFFLLFILLWQVKPILTGEIGTIYTQKQIPEDYKKIKKILLSDTEFYRTLWIPTISRWSFYSKTHPEISGIEIIKNDWYPFVKNYDIEDYTEGEMLMEVMSGSYADPLLDVSSVRYVIVPLVDDMNDDNFFIHYGLTRDEYITLLNDMPFLEKKELGLSEIVVYENKNFNPHAYLTKEKNVLSGNEKNIQIEFTQKKSTEYYFRVKNVDSPFFLNFSESYNAGWKIGLGNFSWSNALFKQQYANPDKNHFSNFGNLNSFYIDPELFCRSMEECARDSDNSYSFDGTIYFLPQAYLIFGGIVSGTIFTILIFSFLYFMIKNK